MEPILSIVILTYNRKQRLLNQLQSIYAQKESDQVLIEIIDNHSNYDVAEAIREEFGEERTKNLHVNINPTNYGMHANLAMPFLHCHTDWMWTLSDDDTTEIDSIATILTDINAYPSTAVFKYKINTSNSNFKETEITSLTELIDYYLHTSVDAGHLIFLSNNVYNMKKAWANFTTTLSHCYSCIAQMLPMFHILDNKDGILRMRDKQLVNFIPPEPGSGYPYLYTAVEISSTVMFKFNLSNKYYQKFGFLVTKGFSHYKLAMCALQFDDRQRGRFLYNQVYSRSFQHSGNLLDKIYYCLYNICYCLHLQLPEKGMKKIRTKIRTVFPNFR